MSDEEALAAEETDDTVGEAEEEEEKDLEAKLKEAVGVDVEDIGGLRRKVTVTIPRIFLDEQTADQYAELSRSALVPGFRRGRAPHRLIEKRFGKEVNEQIVSQMLGSGYLAAIDKAELKTVSDPLIWVGPGEGDKGEPRLVKVEEALDELTIPSEGDLTFACEVEVRPEFELPRLDGIPLTKPKVSITKADVQEQIDRFRGMRGTFEPAQGKIKPDDLVIADVQMSVEDTVVQAEDNMQLSARGQQLFGMSVPNLGDELVGKKAGDRVRFETEVPDDYEKAALRGKKSSFDVVIHEFKRLALPPVDEAFLSSLGFGTEAELRDWVKKDLESRFNEVIRQALRGQVYEYLLENTEFELPKGMSSRQTDRVVMRRVLDLRRQGVPDAEISKHIDELRTSARDDAARQLKLSFIMETVAEQRDVHVTEEEVNAQIAQIAARYNRRFDRVRDDLSRGEGLSSLYQHIRDEKIIDALIAEAEITEKEVPKKGPPKTTAGQKKTKKKPSTKKTTGRKSKQKKSE
ncbi:MAG: trigger factor [Phycisphaerales bacterium]|nr:MAG: trigger factor [Phycisphaerales bacterium]